MSVLNRLSGGVAGIAIGGAASDAISPILETVKQTSWGQRAYRVLAPTAAAEADVRGIDFGVDYVDDAKRQGVGINRYRILRELARTRPGLPDLLDLWRRGRITRGDVVAALRREGFTDWWADRLAALSDYLLPPSDVIRLAVHEVYNPARRNALDLDAEFPAAFAEKAALVGITEPDARDLWAGHWDLPSYGQAAQMLFRKVINRDQFRNLIAALDYAPTWRGPLEQIARAIPTMTDFQRLARREVYNPEQRRALQLDAEFPEAFAEKAALHGMARADTEDLWAGGWRLPSATQGFHMLWRGEIDEGELRALLKALDYSPTWRDKLANIARPTPGRIDLRRMLQAGIITRAEAIAGYEKLGYTHADAVRLVGLASVTGATTAKGLTAADLATEYEARMLTRGEYVAALRELGYSADAADDKADVSEAKLIREAHRAVIERAHRQFVAWRLDQPAVERALADAELAPELASQLLADWTLEREMTVHGLTQAQVVAAYKKAFLTRDQALERLIDLGLESGDALILLGADPRRLTVTDIVKAYLADQLTRDEAIARLVELGFTPRDAAIRIDTAASEGV